MTSVFRLDLRLVVDDVDGDQHFEIDRASVPSFVEAAHDIRVVHIHGSVAGG
jgi:hypothetical protein